MFQLHLSDQQVYCLLRCVHLILEVCQYSLQDEVITWKYSPHCWPFARIIHQSVVDSPYKGFVMQWFDVSFNITLNKLLNKQLSGRWIKISWCSLDVTVMLIPFFRESPVSLGWHHMGTKASHLTSNLTVCSTACWILRVTKKKHQSSALLALCEENSSQRDSFMPYSISQEICTRFLLCCALLWLYIDWFSHIHQAYFTGTVAI